MDRKAIKAKAKEFAFSHKWAIWKPILVVALISGLISGIINAFLQIDLTKDTTIGSLYTAAVQVVLCVLTIGEIYYIRKVIHGKEVSIKEDVFHFFPKYVGVFVPMLALGIITSISAIVSLILPGDQMWVNIIVLIVSIAEIIFTFMFVQTPLILSEDKEENFGGITALKMSKEMMDGYKWDYFCFMFSYIGWILLCVFVIPVIWVIPYIMTGEVMYYEELKKLNK
jgi:uncharacterized membrane protein